jgi:hypothetical protein
MVSRQHRKLLKDGREIEFTAKPAARLAWEASLHTGM